VDELGRRAGTIATAPTVAELREALIEAVGDLVHGDARSRLVLLVSDDLRRFATAMGDGRLVGQRYLPMWIAEELSGFAHVFACPLRCRDRAGVEVLRGAMFVGMSGEEPLADLELPLRTLAALDGSGGRVPLDRRLAMRSRSRMRARAAQNAGIAEALADERGRFPVMYQQRSALDQRAVLHAANRQQARRVDGDHAGGVEDERPHRSP